MKKIFIVSLLTVFAFLLLVNCSDADVNDPRGSSAIPQKIDINTIRVNNLSGTSVIYYDRPDDRNLKYVQAVYELEDGTIRKFNASYFTDSILVDGFPEAGEYDVKLYSVSYGETYSDPVTVKINPDVPPYKKVLADCETSETFSGFRFTSVDEVGTDLSILFVKKSAQGTWEEIGAYYTRKSRNLAFTIREQEAVESDYGVLAMDKWGHKSDTTFFTLTPWFEIEIPKKNPLWKELKLPTDAPMHTWSGAAVSMDKLWDGAQGGSSACYHTVPGGGIPHWNTIDLGAQYLFSRMVIHFRGGMQSAAYLTAYCPKTFELYGSNNPSITGEFDESWDLIDTFQVLREDGTQAPQTEKALTANEIMWYTGGMNFDMPAGIPPYRYIRWKMLSTYGGLDYTAMGELTLYGQIPSQD